MSSWGYVLERGVGMEEGGLAGQLSRVAGSGGGIGASHHDEAQDEYGTDHTSQIHLVGRIVLNVWRLMRAEVSVEL